MTVLDIDNLCKEYESFRLGPIDMQLEEGTAHGLIGPNGAGKSTLFRCIIGTVRRNKGVISINGSTADSGNGQWKQSIGYIGDYTPLFERWSGARNLREFSKYYQHWSHQDAISMASRLDLDLSEIVKNYSTGQRAKLAIVLALAHRASLLLLDEPANGLDPLARDTFQSLLYEQMRNENLAVLYATHHISEIEPFVDHLTFIDAGKLLQREAKEDLAQSWRKITFRASDDMALVPGEVARKVEGRDYELISDDFQRALSFLEQSHAEHIQTSRLSIEKICVQILRMHEGGSPG